MESVLVVGSGFMGSGIITAEQDLSSAARAQWVIEAALETVDLKLEIFEELDRLASPETPLASNSSFIPPTRIAKATKHPERVLGLHFFGPVPLMRMVEVIKGEKTSPEVFQAGVAFVQSLGHTPIRVQKDIPGFALNRMIGQTMIALGLENLVSRSDLIASMVKEGRLGRKAGKGFYRYTAEGKRLPWHSDDQK
jgi:3-hydroxybutyryl-CoA dehydrogenase